MKSFIITVDTEGDNLWCHHPGDEITTRNAAYIPRFQNMCEEFGFKPVYLTNYEMACSERFVADARDWLERGTCEIGVHLHAWNNPPVYNIEGPYQGQPYLIEYPEEVMREKFRTLYNLLTERFGVTPKSHRSGRWAMDATYFGILKEFGIETDCSFTPFISWVGSPGITRGGSDYTRADVKPSVIDGVLEVPMTVRLSHWPLSGKPKRKLQTLLHGRPVWLRPAMERTEAMTGLIDKVDREGTDFLEFMIHSSELMPGGSPYNLTQEDVERFYAKIRAVFERAASRGYEGRTLSEYHSLILRRK